MIEAIFLNRFRPTVLALGLFLNNDLWTVQVGVGDKTEMCNVHVHSVMFIELLTLTAGRGRIAYRSLWIASLSLTSDH